MHNNKEDENVKLDWMYKKPGQKINHEDYLLGKTIDKEFEVLAQEERIKSQEEQGLAPKNHVEHECVPFSIRSYKNAPQEQVDMARKLQEDPLVAIKRKEMETRQQLLQNPVKLKELHRILKEEKMKKIKKKKKKKDSNEKNHKKSKHKDKSKKMIEKDLDDILAEKYTKLKATLDETLDMGSLLKSKSDQSSSSDSDDDFDSNDEVSNKRKSKHRTNQDSYQSGKYKIIQTKSGSEYTNSQKYKSNERRDYANDRNHYEYKSTRSRRDYNSHYRKDYDRQVDKHTNTHSHEKRHVNISRGKCSNSEKESYINKNKLLEKDYKNANESTSSDSEKNEAYIKKDEKTSYYGLVTADGKKIELKRSNKHVQKASDSKSKSITKKQFLNPKRPKLSEEEIELRRKEMQENALWRDKELEKNIKKYKDEDKKEKDKNCKDFDTEFLKKQLARAAEKSTLESRIKSNINNIQRSGRSMDINFARR